MARKNIPQIDALVQRTFAQKCGTMGSTLIRTTRSGSVIIHADGWAGCMLFFPPFYCLMAATALLFIPDLIRLPSERRRYRWK